MKAGRFRSLPIGAQIFALLVFTIVTAQAMTILALYLLPPSGPPRYSVEDVVAAFRGDVDAGASSGRVLLRRRVDVLPDEFSDRRAQADRGQLIATALSADEADVRMVMRQAPWLVLLTSGRQASLERPGQAQRPPGPSDANPPRPDGPPPMPEADQGPRTRPPGDRPPPPGEPPPPGGLGGSPPASGGASGEVIGEFAAAWRQADGAWLVVEPSPEMEWIRRLLFWFGGGLLVVAPIGYWFARRITAPLRSFANSAEQLGRDPQAPHMALEGPAEIGMAARAFNAMQDRIQRFVSDRMGMMAAISHDLRTPLTRLRFKVEGAEPKLRDAVLSDVAKMEQMIAAVLAFLRESKGAAPHLSLDIASIVSCAADAIIEVGGEVEFSGDAPALVVSGDAIALERLFTNLIENAVKYGERARISIRADAEEVVVTINDDGPGVPQFELDKVFTPFYRAADTRGKSGIGLGLPIARAIARAHGGDVLLRTSAKGTAAEVVLPLAADAEPGFGDATIDPPLRAPQNET